MDPDANGSEDGSESSTECSAKTSMKNLFSKANIKKDGTPGKVRRAGHEYGIRYAYWYAVVNWLMCLCSAGKGWMNRSTERASIHLLHYLGKQYLAVTAPGWEV